LPQASLPVFTATESIAATVFTWQFFPDASFWLTTEFPFWADQTQVQQANQEYLIPRFCVHRTSIQRFFRALNFGGNALCVFILILTLNERSGNPVSLSACCLHLF
jgi:hypothetical protein